MGDFKELLNEAKKQIKEVSVQEVRDKLNPDNGFTLVDVREGDEWEQGHLDKALFLPRGFLEVKADKTLTDKNQPVVVYQDLDRQKSACRCLLRRRGPIGSGSQDSSGSRIFQRLLHARRLHGVEKQRFPIRHT